MQRPRKNKRPKKRRKASDATPQTPEPIRQRVRWSLQGVVLLIALSLSALTLADGDPDWLAPAYVLCTGGLLLLIWSAMTYLPHVVDSEQGQLIRQFLYAASILVCLMLFDAAELRWSLLLMTIILILTILHDNWRDWVFPQR